MVKGIQRQMVIVRTTESEIFETAYFVLRADAKIKKGQKSIMAEANSIVSAVCADGSREKREKRKKRLRRALLFFGGALSGAAVFWGVKVLIGFFGALAGNC